MSNSNETRRQQIEVLRSSNQLRVNTQKAASLLGVSVRTLEEWRKKKTGPAYLKLGPKLVRYEVAELERFLARSR